MARAEASGIRLNNQDAAIAKGMIARGDRQHDIAAWFGVNGGRIGEISSGAKFSHVSAASEDQLPPPGPYLSGRSAHKAVAALEQAKAALEDALANIEEGLSSAHEYDQE
ncbi:hypothetical protein OCA5_c30240 [Afipia carboxidovorans OM5]|uniref:Uncharacterized protein n=1 Tax=Afipia carboxidovorans (strain ATCC 49405 / DSM 1227 / KCTC 32145 / OM5) TaxID=504832 RepID=F8BYW8_AFIC5|nr:hypothetical protein [Afipia carboxidovorans]AEI04078.1 hypothetical protein OCA4_c29720 [Afipia carboxidovorans OM4]AEI07708.1 hypothetical protein OCA5_c30240 [Afipia carboxidovorans OM5]